MGSVDASVEVPAPLADVWGLIVDPQTWASWVDGFGSVESVEGYPAVGGTVRWRSTPAGRGIVTETVLELEERRILRVAYQDPGSRGEVRTTVEIVAQGSGEPRTRVGQRLDYELTAGGPLRAITDRLFIRPQMRGALQRTLAQLRVEAGEMMGGFEPPPPDIPAA